MNRSWVLWVAIGASLAACQSQGGAAHVAPAATARVTKVKDGDSFEARRGDEALVVRLHGIDCPERDQPFGEAAKRHAASLLTGRSVELEERDRDDYGRVVARVHAGGTDVNLALVEAGFAWHFTRFSDDPALAEAERRARRARRGLWSQADPEPPWEYRERVGTRSRRGNPAGETSAEPRGYVGNTRSGVFHRASCANATCSHCTERFGSRHEAMAAGRRPAGCCRP